MIVKFGWRYSLLYPSLFVITLGLRRLVQKGMGEVYKEGTSFLNFFFIYVVQIIMSSILLWKENRKNKSRTKSQFLGIALVENSSVLTRQDSDFKIIVLLIFAAFFELIGALIRRLSSNSVLNYDEIYAKYRSSEIIIASILCYFTLKTKIYRHQIFSLILMFIYLIIAVSCELIIGQPDYELLITLSSSIFRVFLDTSEKYLFNYDFIDLNKMMLFEGIINTILAASVFLFSSPQQQLSNFISFYDVSGWKFFLTLILLIVYSIVTGFKNIYRRETIKEFTPMTRILAQSILDPYFIIIEKNNYENTLYFVTILIFSFVMIFCSCIYNEVFVLYVCGLEKDTHLEIAHDINIGSSSASRTFDGTITE
jgi:hypothetical protein